MTPPRTLPIKILKKQPATVPENVPWSELPFAEEGPEPDLGGAVKETFRKMRKTLRYLKQSRPAKGWTSWDLSGKKKEEKIREFYLGFCRETLRFYCKTISI